MRRQRIGKLLHAVLVPVICLCLALGRPAILYAGPCEDDARAAHQMKVDACMAAFFQAQAVHDAAVEVHQILRQAAAVRFVADIGTCQTDYDTAVEPCNEFLTNATFAFTLTLAFEIIVGCMIFGDPSAVGVCIGTALAIHAAAEAAAAAGYLYCIWGAWSAYDDCMELANEWHAELMADADGPKAQADQAWLQAQGTRSQCVENADDALDLALAACAALNPPPPPPPGGEEGGGEEGGGEEGEPEGGC